MVTTMYTQEVKIRGKKKLSKKKNQSSLQIKVDYDIYFVCKVSKVYFTVKCKQKTGI